MISVASTSRIFVFTEPTDMRKSFNGLSGIVAQHFDVELLSGHLFLFFNRRARLRQGSCLGSGRIGDLVQAT